MPTAVHCGTFFSGGAREAKFGFTDLSILTRVGFTESFLLHPVTDPTAYASMYFQSSRTAG